jgi:hypothetical protein
MSIGDAAVAFAVQGSFSFERLKLRVEALEKTPRVMVSVKRGASSQKLEP